MAFIANTAFEARITNNANDALAHIAGKYQYSSADADCSAGQLVVRASQAPNEGFDNPSGTRVYNENTWIMNDASSSATVDTGVYACDTYDTQLGTVGGNNYFVGTKTLGLGVPAGRYGNFTRIDFDNQSVYRFGAGNISNTVSTNTYFTITSGGLLYAQASAPTATGAIYFTLRGTGKFVEGNGATITYYDLVACKVSVVNA